MADVVILDMEKPENCMDCPFVVCLKTKDNCPIFALPEGHGRMLDADALLSVLDILKDKGCDGPVWDQMRDIVESMVTFSAWNQIRASTLESLHKKGEKSNDV